MLFFRCNLKGRTLKNHIVFPPVLCFGWSRNGEMTGEHLEHYRNVAKGGAGLIISEVTCIDPDARIDPSQLGIWSDEFIEGYRNLARICHDEGVPVLAQIQHGGVKAITGTPVLPSKLTEAELAAAGIEHKAHAARARELDVAEIKAIETQFIDAAKRIKEAGLDGVEIHGAHGFLLSYFLSSITNKRQDEYGGSLENRARLAVGIIKALRRECGEDFIIGIRYGGATPTLDDGIGFAKIFEDSGCDILHISTGATSLDAVTAPEKYAEFAFPVYTAVEIKKHISIPVIASNSVGTLDRAKILVDGGLVDFTAFARNILADYEWVRKTERGLEVNRCLRCKTCRWFKKALTECPARRG
ncbi:MAG: NADH:flavin oxidoreductase [Treponema sp.]|jgi:2,4-dienoyl-CoA reductase-like NADH-dependent reductase (Old Yellow Enzyme family)|nr:NADH:flavin oxidoreductase [Treponema sp.]